MTHVAWPRFGKITVAHPSPCVCPDAFPVPFEAGDTLGMERCSDCGGWRVVARPQHQQNPSDSTLSTVPQN